MFLQERNQGQDLGLITPLPRIDELSYWALPLARLVVEYTPIYSHDPEYIIYDVESSDPRDDPEDTDCRPPCSLQAGASGGERPLPCR